MYFFCKLVEKRVKVFGVVLLLGVYLICIIGKWVSYYLFFFCFSDVYNKINVNCIFEGFFSFINRNIGDSFRKYNLLVFLNRKIIKDINKDIKILKIIKVDYGF